MSTEGTNLVPLRSFPYLYKAQTRLLPRFISLMHCSCWNKLFGHTQLAWGQRDGIRLLTQWVHGPRRSVWHDSRHVTVM